jgi:hypothetical protein
VKTLPTAPLNREVLAAYATDRMICLAGGSVLKGTVKAIQEREACVQVVVRREADLRLWAGMLDALGVPLMSETGLDPADRFVWLKRRWLDTAWMDVPVRILHETAVTQ